MTAGGLFFFASHGQRVNKACIEKEIIYTDWTASGRLYRPIEEKLLNQFGPFVANTHTETSITGSAMTMAYHKARNIIKNHVNANRLRIIIILN